MHFKKIHKIYNSFFFQRPIIGNPYIFAKWIDNFKFRYSSKIVWGVGFSLSAHKRRFILYNSFDLRLTESLHQQKHFPKTSTTCFIYIIFSKMYNYFFLFTTVRSVLRSVNIKNNIWGKLIGKKTCISCACESCVLYKYQKMDRNFVLPYFTFLSY